MKTETSEQNTVTAPLNIRCELTFLFPLSVAAVVVVRSHRHTIIIRSFRWTVAAGRRTNVLNVTRNHRRQRSSHIKLYMLFTPWATSNCFDWQ